MSSNEQLIIEKLEARNLIRKQWTDGRERACLLATLAPECGTQESPAACPASIMPLWLAYLTPWIDDAGSDEAWEGHVRHYAALSSRWHVLDERGWRRALLRSLIAILSEARQHDRSDSCTSVIALCERELADAPPTIEEWQAAAAAKATAAKATAEAAKAAAKATAAKATAEAAKAAAKAAWAWAKAAAWAEAAEAASDRIINGILSGIKTEIEVYDHSSAPRER